MKKLLLALLLTYTSALALDIKEIKKTSFEKFLLEADFTPAISADAFSIVSVTAVNASTGADATSTLIATSPAPAIPMSTAHVVFMCQGGVKGQTYRVSVKIHDSDSEEDFEGVFVVTII